MLFAVDHIGFSTYIAGFDAVSASLRLDPENPEGAELHATIEVVSLDLPTPPPGFRETLLGPDWFDAGSFPVITFASDRIVRTGALTADIHGTLTLRGASRHVVLHATYNGGWGRQPFEPQARAGFSATAAFLRSDFGMGYGIPPAGSDLGVGDEVRVTIETEWTGEPFR